MRTLAILAVCASVCALVVSVAASGRDASAAPQGRQQALPSIAQDQNCDPTSCGGGGGSSSATLTFTQSGSANAVATNGRYASTGSRGSIGIFGAPDMPCDPDSCCGNCASSAYLTFSRSGSSSAVKDAVTDESLITCAVTIDNPHASSHVPGNVNVVSHIDCGGFPMTSLSLSTKLWRAGYVVGSGKCLCFGLVLARQ
jgi:hypothetical protein